MRYLNLGATGACEPTNPDRKTFRDTWEDRTITLTVPNWLEDEQVRNLIDRGEDLVPAYERVQISGILPEQGMRECIFDALKLKYLDPTTGEMEITGGNYTCIQFFDCFSKYLKTLRLFGEAGRILIADDIYAPSPAEEACIKTLLPRSGNIRQAYSDCGARDIFPEWPQSAPTIQAAMEADPTRSLHNIIKTEYFFYISLEYVRPVDPGLVSLHHAPPPPGTTFETMPALGWVALGGVFLLAYTALTR